ncbi:MAG: MBL fold metallo-hydrolase [Candidatus Heimdallarchaeota archaeon]
MSKGKDLIQFDSIQVRLIYFDSMGAKCSSVLVSTPDVSILVDPGASVLQPSFPLSSKDKAMYCEEAYERICRFGVRADVIVITHYHYDHYPNPAFLDSMDAVFREKTLLIKDPNQWINQSQNKRALEFLRGIYQEFGISGNFKEVLVDPHFQMQNDPYTSHPKTAALWRRAKGKKSEVFQAKQRWLDNSVRRWQKRKWVPDFQLGDIKILLADGREVTFGQTKLQFSHPMFHGQFLAKIGWVIGFTVEYEDSKFMFTSDLQGPIIEEYADWIVQTCPNIIVADGPPLYAYGYMLGKAEIDRIVNNMLTIMSQTRPKKIIWDHHLCRGLFKSKLKNVYSYAKKMGVRVCTAAEHMGHKPLIEQLKESSA